MGATHVAARSRMNAEADLRRQIGVIVQPGRLITRQEVTWVAWDAVGEHTHLQKGRDNNAHVDHGDVQRG